MRLGSYPVGPSLAQREAYIDLWCSCQIGDAYTDLSIHLFDTYTRSRVNAAVPLNPNSRWWPHSKSTQHPVSHGHSSTQWTQTWIHWWLGPRHTHQETKHCLLQYLQPFEGCRLIEFRKVGAAQIADWDRTVSIFTVIPNRIKTSCQTVLTVHWISGVLHKTHSNEMGGVRHRRYR